MDVYYFEKSRVPHLAKLVRELGIPDRIPYTMGENFQCDPVINEYFKYLALPLTPSPQTWRTYAEQLSIYMRFLDASGITWRDATEDDLARFYRVRRISGDANGQTIGVSSWNLFVAAAAKFYEWALERGLIDKVPFNYRRARKGYQSDSDSGSDAKKTATIRERPRKKDIKYMSIETFKALMLPALESGQEGLRNTIFAKLLVTTGLRVSEARNLRLDQIPNPDAPQFAGRKTCWMSVKGKGSKTRRVRVPKALLRDIDKYKVWDRQDAIQKWKDKHPNKTTADHDYLFLSRSGEHVAVRSLQDMLAVACDIAGIDFSVHPHLFRHTFAIYQLSSSIRETLKAMEDAEGKPKELSGSAKYRRLFKDPLRALQRLMGHESITSTFIYLDYLDEVDEMIDEAGAWTEEVFEDDYEIKA